MPAPIVGTQTFSGSEASSRKRTSERSKPGRETLTLRGPRPETVMATSSYGTQAPGQDEFDHPHHHQVPCSLEMTPDSALHDMDRLVSDLLASYKTVETQNKKIAALEDEVARLEDESSSSSQWHLHHSTVDIPRAVDQRLNISSAQRPPGKDGEVEELQRLVAFYRNNSEEVSRRLRELQTHCRDLQASVQAKDAALEESNSWIKHLRSCRGDPSAEPQEAHEASGSQ